MEPTKELITWLIVSIGTSLVTIIGAIFSWVKAVKMMPKEAKGADLDNMGKSASVADKFNDIALKAAEQAVSMQTRLSSIENDYSNLKIAHDDLARRVVMQDTIIKEQSRTIEAQTARLNTQDTKISEQEELICSLRFDLDSTNEYNATLIQQMKSQNLVPLEAPKTPRKTNGKNVGEAMPPK